MSRTVKWILGIVIGLVALCALAAVGLFAVSRLNLVRLAVGRRAVLPFAGRPSMPMAPFQGMPYRHFGAFSPFGFFGGWLIVAALLGLFALAVIALVIILRRPGRPALQPAAATPPPVMQSAAVEQPPSPDSAAPPAPSGQNCPSCGREIQADWSHCPYCGTALTV
jgi:zinc-ribbon domain